MIEESKMIKPEILAPAGDIERLYAGILFGADAVYLAGKEYGMRTAPTNFERDEMKKAVEIAHQSGVKVYVTCNTFPVNDEIERMPEYLEFLQDIKVDALIIADLGVMMLAHKHAPKCDVHISTQAGITNYETARYFYNEGAKRVVLAREMSLDQIAQLSAKTPSKLEIECFVHGAMCMAISGRCMLSAYLTDRRANSGDCTQPCRWKFDLMEPNREGLVYGVEQDHENTFLFNANDLCMIEHLPALHKAGVTSFKIEGRAKAEYYVAVVTNAYNTALNEYIRSGFDPKFKVSQWIVEETLKVSHRPYGTGFYFDKPAQNTKAGGYIRDYQVVGVVEGYSDGLVQITQRNNFKRGTKLDVLEPGGTPFDLNTECLLDEHGGEVEVARHPMMKLQIPFERPIKQGSFCRVKLN